MRPNQTYKVLHCKENHKQNEKTINRMGENTPANKATDKGLISKTYEQFP